MKWFGMKTVAMTINTTPGIPGSPGSPSTPRPPGTPVCPGDPVTTGPGSPGSPLGPDEPGGPWGPGGPSAAAPEGEQCSLHLESYYRGISVSPDICRETGSGSPIKLQYLFYYYY